MRHIALVAFALSLLAATCERAPPPTPPEPEPPDPWPYWDAPPVSPDAGVACTPQPSTCAGMCAHLACLGCREGLSPVCVPSCENALLSGYELNVACLVRVTACSQVDRVSSGGCR